MSRPPPLNGGEGVLCLKPRSDPGASSRRLLHSGVNACSSPPPQKLLRRLSGNDRGRQRGKWILEVGAVPPCFPGDPGVSGGEEASCRSKSPSLS